MSKAEQKAFRDSLDKMLHSHIDRDPHPAILALFEEKPNPELLAHISIEAYQITQHFIDYIEHLHFYCPVPRYKLPLLVNLYEESTGAVSGSKNHISLMEDFLKAQGIDKSRWENVKPNPETLELINYRKKACRNPETYHIGAAAVMIASEGQNLEDVAAEARSSLLEAKYGLAEKDTLFFSIHAVEDIGHTQQGLSLVSEICTTDKMKEEALEAVDHTSKLFWNMYEAIWVKYQAGEGIAYNQ